MRGGADTFKHYAILIILVLFCLSLTDFIFYLNANLVIYVFFALIFLSVNTWSDKLKVNIYVVVYGALILSLAIINIAFSSDFNFVTFTQVIAYLIYFSISRENINIHLLLDQLVKLMLITCLVFAAIEISVKVFGFKSLVYLDFIRNHGNMRFDVLRARTLFGSSLSTAAMGIFFSVYFFIFKKSSLFILFTLVLILLSGSRTGFALFMLLLIFSILNKIFASGILGKKSIFDFVVVLCISSIILPILYFSPVSHIITRSIQIKMDASFLGRSTTSGQAYYDIIADLPRSLFLGIESNYISDSAIISVMAGSGVLALIAFCSLVVFLLYCTRSTFSQKLVLVLVFFLGALMIGDFFIPSVTFMYILTFLSYRKTSTRKLHVKNQIAS